MLERSRKQADGPDDPLNPAQDAVGVEDDASALTVRSTAQKNPHAAALGRLGGQKGGPARAMRLSAERRSEIAQKAAQARWRNRERDQ